MCFFLHHLPLIFNFLSSFDDSLKMLSKTFFFYLNVKHRFHFAIFNVIFLCDFFSPTSSHDWNEWTSAKRKKNFAHQILLKTKKLKASFISLHRIKCFSYYSNCKDYCSLSHIMRFATNYFFLLLVFLETTIQKNCPFHLSKLLQKFNFFSNFFFLITEFSMHTRLAQTEIKNFSQLLTFWYNFLFSAHDFMSFFDIFSCILKRHLLARFSLIITLVNRFNCSWTVCLRTFNRPIYIHKLLQRFKKENQEKHFFESC